MEKARAADGWRCCWGSVGDHQGSDLHLWGNISGPHASCLEGRLNSCSCDEHYVCSIDCMARVMGLSPAIDGELPGLGAPWVALAGQSGP